MTFGIAMTYLVGQLNPNQISGKLLITASEEYLDGVQAEVMRVFPNPRSETRCPKPET